MKISRRFGFTLVELLISAAIVTILAVTLYGSFQGGLLSYRSINASLQRDQTARLIFKRMALDLTSSFAYSQEDSYFMGDSRRSSFFTVVKRYDNQGVSFSEIAHVAYEFDSAVFTRASKAGVDALLPDAGSIRDELSTLIKDVRFSYAVARDSSERPFIWQESWPAASSASQKHDLPIAIRVDLTLGGVRGQQGSVLTKVIALALGGQQR
ncbi:MAG: prepilin-type N-terminal cleavage/methylation domain-containing protein [Candidatus Omnitrophica bacterium]|nr:prepilin-type N-terminal cleavage/methylation domain-containing protein [Candidatus Omnitrophota bacterium]